MDTNSITTEIRKLIADKIDNKELINIDWLTHEIVDSKDDIEGEDVEFYRLCAYKHIRDVVKSCVGMYETKKRAASPDAQLVLTGFEHLQVAYTVDRGGETVLVPVDLLSDNELLARAAEYDVMAKGCRKHALELREYVTNRAQAA